MDTLPHALVPYLAGKPETGNRKNDQNISRISPPTALPTMPLAPVCHPVLGDLLRVTHIRVTT
jgi:hypothetical protein